MFKLNFIYVLVIKLIDFVMFIKWLDFWNFKKSYVRLDEFLW